MESSTVDIAQQFTNLIVYQRGYEANSKVITAVDQLSQTIFHSTAASAASIPKHRLEPVAQAMNPKAR